MRGKQSDSYAESWLVTAAGIIGNVLEWYDFSIFGFYSDIISDIFFPPEEEDDVNNSNLIKTFAIFGSAFLMRPFGGLLIGYIGDKHGRKMALTTSLFLMAVPTTLMGCLPTYKSVGALSPILLVFCRLLQGLSVGGQLPASLVYTVEKRDESHWGFYGALPMSAAVFGSLLGNIVATSIRQNLSEEEMLKWGWRVPFFSGIIVALTAYYLKTHGADLHTTAGVYDSTDSTHTNPIKSAFRRGNRLSLIQASLTPVLSAAGAYVTHVWMPIYMSELLRPPIEYAFWVSAVGMACSTIMLPFAGHVSDKIGRVTLMTISAIMVAILGPLAFLLIPSNHFWAFPFQIILSITLSFFIAPLPAWLIENFPADVRLTSVSIGWDLAHAVVAGFSPLLATLLFHVTKYAPGFIYTFFGLISIIGIYITNFLGEGRKKERSYTIKTVDEIGEGRGDEPPKELPQIL